MWNPDLMDEIKGRRSSRWRVGERVATPNGFIAEIVSLTDERALIAVLRPVPERRNFRSNCYGLRQRAIYFSRGLVSEERPE